MKIALYLSGRLTGYKECLINSINSMESFGHDVHLFVSINSEKNDNLKLAEDDLSKWLRSVYYEPYEVPPNFENFHPETLRQSVNGKLLPYTNLSHFYNKKKSFELAINYSDTNQLEYDIYCFFRSDIMIKNFTDFHKVNKDNNYNFYSCTPPCVIYWWGNPINPHCISDAFVYGNRNSMKKYSSAYDFIIKANSNLNGNYRINYEPCQTEAIYDMIINSSKEENFFKSYDKIKLQDYNLVNNEVELRNVVFNSKLKITDFHCAYSLYPNRRSLDNIKHT